MTRAMQEADETSEQPVNGTVADDLPAEDMSDTEDVAGNEEIVAVDVDAPGDPAENRTIHSRALVSMSMTFESIH